MLDRLLPARLDNAYRGSWAAVWVLAPVLIAKTLMGFNFSGLNPLISVGHILETVDGVPLHTFGPAAADAVMESARAWGAALFALCLVVWAILLRYRAGLPLAILVLLLEQAIRTGAGVARTASALATGGHPPTLGGLINLAMTAMLVVAFALSLFPARGRG